MNKNVWKIFASILFVIIGVLSLIFLHGYHFPYTIYVPILLGCIAFSCFFICSLVVSGIFRCQAAVKWIDVFSAGIAIAVFAPVVIIELAAFLVHPFLIFLCFLLILSLSVFLAVLGMAKSVQEYRRPVSGTCPCRKTGCKNHGNCEACRAEHRKKEKPTSCERQKQKQTSLCDIVQ